MEHIINIDEIVAQGEGQRVEFKTSFNEDVIETLVAFAYFSRDYSLKDLDFDKIQRFISKVNEVGRFSLEGTPTECLEKLKYISGDKVTNAAVLLFASEGSTYNVHLGRLNLLFAN